MTSPASPSPVVAVVDIGSNSIKLLVASRAPDDTLHELAQHTKETRLGHGISGNPPRLGDEAMNAVVAAVQALLATAAPCAPTQVRIVATSAVRDAANQAEFAGRIRSATGHDLQVLSGDDEARLIGCGIRCETALRSEAAFYAFDLGGGSLEMLTFIGGRVQQAISLPLGCVRLTEMCVTDPAQPLPAGEAERIRTHVRETIAASGFRFDLPPESPAIVTGGTATTVRAMRAAAWGRALFVESPVMAVTELHRFGIRTGEASLEDRQRIPGLPPSRADVFPAAIITLEELATIAGITAFRHSFYNLRYGIASELLGVA